MKASMPVNATLVGGLGSDGVLQAQRVAIVCQTHS
jgi:hypothetical protein